MILMLSCIYFIYSIFNGINTFLVTPVEIISIEIRFIYYTIMRANEYTAHHIIWWECLNKNPFLNIDDIWGWFIVDDPLQAEFDAQRNNHNGYLQYYPVRNMIIT